jgi:hypothetical protein
MIILLQKVADNHPVQVGGVFCSKPRRANQRRQDPNGTVRPRRNSKRGQSELK